MLATLRTASVLSYGALKVKETRGRRSETTLHQCSRRPRDQPVWPNPCERLASFAHRWMDWGRITPQQPPHCGERPLGQAPRNALSNGKQRGEYSKEAASFPDSSHREMKFGKGGNGQNVSKEKGRNSGCLVGALSSGRRGGVLLLRSHHPRAAILERGIVLADPTIGLSFLHSSPKSRQQGGRATSLRLGQCGNSRNIHFQHGC